MLRPILMGGALLAANTAVAQDTDPQLAFNNNCRTCHSTDEGDNRLGPSLYAVVGREAGSLEGYAYSSSLGRADFTWDEETLDSWIADPDNVVTGHKMKPYSGIAEEETRSAIIAHLAETGGGSDGETEESGS